MNNKIVCFFSASGNTKELAYKINEIVKGDIFEIEPLEVYTDSDLDWTNNESRSSIEMRQGIKPEIKEKISNINNYSDVYLGFPIWWYTAPTIIYKFLEENDTLVLEQTEDKILISIPKNKKIDLEELFKKYKGNNLSKEFEWDEPVGREIW